jgi:hypothetical protein
MRTLIAAALAFALAIPATASMAAACGGDDDITLTRHTASGATGFIGRNDAGELMLFVSYPTVDGEWSGLYGIDATVIEDRVSRRLERDYARWSRRITSPMVDVTIERFGDDNDDGAWRVVSYHLHRAA